MNEMHEKGGAGIKTSGVARSDQPIGGGDARKRPRRLPRDGTVGVSPPPSADRTGKTATLLTKRRLGRASVPRSADRTGKTAGPLTKRRLEGASVPRSADRIGKTARLLTKRRLEGASAPRSAGRSGRTAAALTKTSLPGRAKRGGLGGGAQLLPPWGCETNLAAEMARTFPLRRGRKTRRTGAHSGPSDGNEKGRCAGFGAHKTPPVGAKRRFAEFGAHVSPAFGPQNRGSRRTGAHGRRGVTLPQLGALALACADEPGHRSRRSAVAGHGARDQRAEAYRCRRRPSWGRKDGSSVTRSTS